MNKFVTVKEAADKIHDGMTVMVGGFLGVGNPIALIDALVEKGVKDLTIICNDTAYPEVGVGKLITNHQVKNLIATHIGTNNNTIDQMNAGELNVTLQPQGTLAEQIRAAGAGLGGVLTTTGLGTVVENGKQKVTVDGKEYLLEKPIRAQEEVADILDDKGCSRYSVRYRMMTVSEFRDMYDSLRPYSVQQIGRALSRLGVEETKEGHDKKRLRRLPERVYDKYDYNGYKRS